MLDIIDNCSAGDKISVTVVTKTGAEKSFEAALKANIGESSYSTDINAGTSGSSGSDSSSGGGTFNFPFGE